MEHMHWTHQEYLEQPLELVRAILVKISTENRIRNKKELEASRATSGKVV